MATHLFNMARVSSGTMARHLFNMARVSSGTVATHLFRVCSTASGTAVLLHRRVTSCASERGVWQRDRVLRSPYRDVEVPECALHDYVWQHLDRWPHRTAAECAVTGRAYSYEQAFRRSRTLAAHLRSTFGVREGDAVCVMLPNVPECPLVALAVLQAGGVIASFLPVYTADEVQSQLTLLAPRVIVTMPKLYPTVREALKLARQSVPVIVVRENTEPAPEGTALFSALSEDVHVDTSCLAQVRTDPNDICFLLYSSGTTGKPKGVELSHRNIIANLEQNNEPMIRCYKETTAGHQDAVLCARSLCHIYGTSVLMCHKLSVGARLVVLPADAAPELLLRTLRTHRINVVMVLPTLVRVIAAHADATPRTLAHVDTLVYGGLAVDVTAVERFAHRAQRAVDIRQSYGMTEASPVVTLSPKGLNSFAQTGPPLPSTELRIVDEHLNNLGPNEKGEILIRGPQVTRGYKNNPQANSEAFTADGWFRSGDLGVADERGVLTVGDRLKELIKINGCPVAPAELESLFREHPAVDDVGVIGVTHVILGEVPKALIVLKHGHRCTEKELKEYINERVATHKRVHHVEFLDVIPKTASGKMLRKVLKEKYV